jgi:hypothetical protein
VPSGGVSLEKPTLRIEEQQPEIFSKADIAPQVNRRLKYRPLLIGNCAGRTAIFKDQKLKTILEVLSCPKKRMPLDAGTVNRGNAQNLFSEMSFIKIFARGKVAVTMFVAKHRDPSELNVS